ncbi:serine/threonine-protein kinase [Microcoleus sp. Pol11C3]|uniref:serine/threonine-protein kinase n=1 Tax=Microcoleus sp. Pol11C3 TaxID=3055390 RepID=UPI002FD65D4B
MNAFPDFSTHGYQVSRELGYNSLGGRVTYLATKINTTNSVVIKQFQFAQLGASWAEYEAYEQEIKVLESLDFPGIPRYFDAFGTDSGFCMVQEYKNAESAIARTFSPPDIKQIAIATLEILAYLQSQKPPVIHRDIKPENLLIDDELNVYLVDFGFARLGGGNIAASSVVKGTMGFMPPEQMFNRVLTQASDLYGLGATLICLLTGTKSVDIGNLIDDNYSIHFRHLVPPLPQGWMNWLERMVAPRLQDRYKSAADALAVLQSLDVSCLPKVRSNRDRLNSIATDYREILTQSLVISNPIPDTILCGRWEVAPHPSDPPHTPYDHPWISFEPQNFENNEVDCQIIIDTGKLLADKIYNRQLVLHANSEPDTYTIELQVTTSPLPIPQNTTLLAKGRLNFMCCFVLAGFLLNMIAHLYLTDYNYLTALGIFSTALYGLAMAEITIMAKSNRLKSNYWFGALHRWLTGLILYILTVVILVMFNLIIFDDNTRYQLLGAFIVIMIAPILTLFGHFLGNMNRPVSILFRFLLSSALCCVSYSFLELIFGGIDIKILGFIFLAPLFYLTANSVVYNLISELTTQKYIKVDATNIAFITAGFGTSLGVVLPVFLNFYTQLEWVEPMEMVALGGVTIVFLSVTAIPLLELIVFRPRRILANYRKLEPNLIKP